jgi:transaldolase
MVNEIKFKSPLHEMACMTPTDFWNDSCAIEELTYAIGHGAVGATSNPVIVGMVLKQEMHLWENRIAEIIAQNPSATEDEISWIIIEEAAVKGSKLLLPIFERENHLKGRLSIQTNPKYYRNAEKMIEQALYFNTLAPNMMVKIPATTAGIKAIEETTYHGVNINATVCFTVPQCIAVAEAVESGLKRREQEGQSIETMRPVCTIMVGRIDDWLREVMNKRGIITEPGYLDWAGVAITKRTYQIYKERKYRLQVLPAAYRNHMHWSEFIGGDLTMTIPYGWQKKFNASDVTVDSRIDLPVKPQIIAALSKHFKDFNRAYKEDGLRIDEFDTFGSTARTLRQFLAGYDDLVQMIRDRMAPDPIKSL